LGEEHFGNAALNEANFQDWPGIMPLVNHPSRVYHSWVNGNEHFYYRGDTPALNKDEDDWVKLNAVGALAVFGKKAESVVPELREMLGTQDKQLKASIEKTIKEIQQAKDTTIAEEEHRTVLKTIREFRDSRK